MIKKLLNLIVIKLYIIFQLLTRITLSAYALWHRQISFSDLPVIFSAGLLNDLVSLCFLLPVILVLTKLFNVIFSKDKPPHYLFSYCAYFLVLALLTFIACSELLFWDEFGSRFNFIAVDYLIYTHEIIGTLRESLPLKEIAICIIVFALVVTIFSLTYLQRQIKKSNDKNYLAYSVFFAIVSLLAVYGYDGKKIKPSSNRYAKELALNGPYEFVAAYYNNSLNYNELYSGIDKTTALNIIRPVVLQGNQQFLNDYNIDRITTGHYAKKYNVILIVVESLSAEFMGKFGNADNITPYLDAISDEGIFFTNIYAVGTRTVRGLEAITLSVPPTPGSSIIRRPNNSGLFNIGSPFLAQGYDINFIFGGYSYFDNLYNYFSGNNYKIIDRSDLKSSEISFTNIWGVADEDILIKCLELADKNHDQDKPFFSLIMTTSNHRPYTFPNNRIDLPSGQGRNAAVKYSDYAIGQFIEAAKKKPWFNDTIFVITADHCASSAGKIDLPVHKYHIPLIIYAPKIVKPRKIANLASQIDIAPTILGLLNFEYQSKFFGKDILNFPANRAFIGTYQLLGFMQDERLVILSPNDLVKTYRIDNDKMRESEDIPTLTQEAIGFYKMAYDLYIEGQMYDFVKSQPRETQ